VLNFCSSATRLQCNAIRKTFVRCTNRPFGHGRRRTRRLIIAKSRMKYCTGASCQSCQTINNCRKRRRFLTVCGVRILDADRVPPVGLNITAVWTLKRKCIKCPKWFDKRLHRHRTPTFAQSLYFKPNYAEETWRLFVDQVNRRPFLNDVVKNSAARLTC